jgi:hypothetical protein
VGEEGENGQPGTILKHLVLLKEMQKRGLLGQVLLSHDGNSFSAGKTPCVPATPCYHPAAHPGGRWLSRRQLDGW